MSLNTALDFFISNITHFIGAFFVVVLFLFAVSIYLGLKEEKAHEADKSDLKGLEETLRKVIDSQPAPAAAAAPDNSAEMKKLKGELSVREKELKELRNSFEEAKKSFESQISESTSAGGATANPVLDTELQKKVDELEARLAEYEIIEDDIANLSLYKEENASLKKEIEALKGGASAAAPSETTAEEKAQTAAAPSTEPPLNPTGGAPEEPAADIMAEFAEAVGGELSDSEPKTEAVPAPPQEPEVAAAPAPEPAAEAETEAPSTEEAAEAEPAAENGGEEEVVFGALDTDKLVEEATSLEGVEDEDDDDDDEDVGQKLISEFEDFVKKDGGV